MDKQNFYENFLNQNIPLTPYYRIRDDGYCACKDAELCKYPGKHPVLDSYFGGTRKSSLFKEWKPVFDVGIVLNHSSNLLVLEAGIHDGKYSYEHHFSRSGLESYLSWKIDDHIYYLFKFDDNFNFSHKCGEIIGTGVKLHTGGSSIKGPYCLSKNRNLVEPIFNKNLKSDWTIEELTTLPNSIIKLISKWGDVCI